MDLKELKNKLNLETTQIWKRIFEEGISGEELLTLTLNAAQINVTTLLINHECNLRCKHCFYGNDELYGEELTADEWKTVIEQLLDIGVRHFHIAGREPFINNKVIEILKHLKKIKESQEIIYGVITNGILVKDYLNELSDLRLDYLDFSVDGTEKSHEWIRGEKTFKKTIDSLKNAVEKNVASTIYVSSVAHKRNYSDLPRMLEYLHKLGVRNFFVQPMLPVGRAKNLKEYVLTPDEYDKMIGLYVSTIKKLDKDAPLNVEILVYPTMFPFLYAKNSIVKESADKYANQGSASILIGRSKLFFDFHSLCLAHWRTCQITADGYYIGCFMMLTSKDYQKYAIGNVRDKSIKELWNESLQKDSLMWKIMKSYDKTSCRNCKYFRFCHSGCRVASNINFSNWNSKDITCYL